MYSLGRLLGLTLLLGLLQSCVGHNVASDEEMMAHFEQHERSYERLRAIAEKYGSFSFYPSHSLPSGGALYKPFTFEEGDSVIPLAPTDSIELDSLMREVGSIRLSYYRPRKGSDAKGNGEVSFVYDSWGLSVTGGGRLFVYDEDLPSRLKKYSDLVASQPERDEHLVHVLAEEDLKALASQYSGLLELYRPLKGHWYISYERDP